MDVLLLVPTRMELARLALPPGIQSRAEICGFGPVAAAARTAQLLARDGADLVLLAGIAGAYLEERIVPLGSALWCEEVTLYGIGAGEGDAFLSVDQLGFPLVHDDEGTSIATTLPARTFYAADTEGNGNAQKIAALTVCAASGDANQAKCRRELHPRAAIEEMEGYGAALSARLFGSEFAMVRGVSNVAGDRHVAAWRIDEALEAVRHEIVTFFRTIDAQS
ncbi:MAG TPA: futalosine hydrolase [Pirellulaceae bacterium]|jgi:futalosine hydrolase|nr:futalosine hydrolase [Pirellulaceae bacterium]